MEICGGANVYVPNADPCECNQIYCAMAEGDAETLAEAKRYTDHELDEYVPRGTVSTPTVTVSSNNETVNSMSSQGTLSSLSATYTASNERLKINWNAGALPTSTAKTVVKSITGATATQPVFTGVKRNA